jgi:hypothetical protein
MSRRTWWLAVFMLGGCGGESFDPSGVSLSGSWLISNETDINAIPPGSGITSNTCTVRNMPVTLEATDDPALWVGRIEDGGTIQCELNGEMAPATPYNPNLFLQVTKTGGGLSVGLPNGIVVYTGMLVADNRMSGTITGELDGRVGTWSARRN